VRGGLIAPLIKLVVFLVVTTLATYVLAATIANTNFGSTYSYHAYFTDASGLESGDDVRIAGVRVGTVSSIKIVKNKSKTDPDLQRVAEVGFTVAKAHPLPSGVFVQLRYRNLVGQRYLDVSQGAGDPSVMLSRKKVIPLSQTAPAVDLTKLFVGFQPLLAGLLPDQINQLSYEIVQTLQGEGGAFETLLSNVAGLTTTLANKDAVIGDLIDNLTAVLNTVGQRDAELDQLIIQLQSFVSGLASDRSAIGDAIVGVNNLANKTAGLLTDIRGPLAQDITDVTGLVGVLNDNTPQVTFFLKELAPTIGTLIRTADYGSWFNFYLCSVNGTLTLPGGVIKNIPLANSTEARCQ
jgi:phospholipid/cholesterol/gamma-HCH transport system substrate-binding protein